jgi:hypothetical protein
MKGLTMIEHSLLRALGAALTLLAAAPASAQLADDLIPASRSFVSPEHFVVEFKGGPYDPEFDGVNSFSTFFNDDSGPFLGLELSYIALRVPDILYVTVGGGIGLTRYDGNALDPAGVRVSEETTFSMIPLTALASLRIDALSRNFSIPFNFAGKIGWQWAHWSTGTGKRDDASGWSLGLLYGGQIALDLDTLEPSAARTMDEEWGINHSFVFFELYRFDPTSDSLPIGDTAWSLGLGFTF